jgi:hypothetical protein
MAEPQQATIYLSRRAPCEELAQLLPDLVPLLGTPVQTWTRNMAFQRDSKTITITHSTFTHSRLKRQTASEWTSEM